MSREGAADKPLVVVTGAAGNIGSALAEALSTDYRVVGLDRSVPEGADDFLEIDLTRDESVQAAFDEFQRRYGSRIASVVHLAAYFDFSGERHPAYRSVNIEGTARLLRALASFEVEQFVYSGTMLVHAPAKPGGTIDESAPIRPRWAYPKSKAEAEAVIGREARMPVVLFHLAGLYDEETAVPTLAHQVARIYERDIQAHLYAGDVRAGQSMIHRDDMLDAFCRAIERRHSLPERLTLLIGEREAVPYDELQELIGRLVHGEEGWRTVAMPGPVAKAGAWLQQKLEPLVPDSIDHGKPPFIRPFMIDMASDHYALDTGRAAELLGWRPRHSIRRTLPVLVETLKRDPPAWYRANGVDPPPWMEIAEREGEAPEQLRQRAEEQYRAEHRRSRWAQFIVACLGTWMITSPPLLGHGGWMAWSDVVSGAVLVVLGLAGLSWRLGLVRWVSAAVGLWLLFAPLAFRTESAAAYLNGTLVGMLVIGFAVLTRPPPGVTGIARLRGPVVPPGWRYSPSAWTQRFVIILLAFVGLYFSRYLAAYQLGHIDGVWEPFFEGGPDPKNGTEEIITSWLSEAWPVPDAGLGALTYALEILVGLIGSARRWRTMPWIVVLFGIMIVPLGIVSITFIIVQPILLGTWCTLCLVGAAAMLGQIPYSLDELVATGQFMARRRRAGESLLRVFFAGGTDEGPTESAEPDLDRRPGAIVGDIVGGGVNVPWNLAACIAIGVWLMFTRVTLGAEGPMANADHLIGALVITVSVTALAEVGRAVRFLNVVLGLALLVTPFAYGADGVQLAASLACGIAVIALSIRRGPVRQRYGSWDPLIV